MTTSNDVTAMLNGIAAIGVLRDWSQAVRTWKDLAVLLTQFADSAPRMNALLAEGRAQYAPGPIPEECIQIALELAELVKRGDPRDDADVEQVFALTERALSHLIGRDGKPKFP